MPAGRPPKYKTPEELEEVIDAYFVSLMDDKGRYIRPPTVTGLAYHLGMTREGLRHYHNKNDEFADTLTRTRTRIEMFLEESLCTSRHVQGIIFNLKNNFGWKDKREEEVTHKGDMAERIIAARKRARIREDD